VKEGDSREAGEKLDDLENLLRDVERRILKHQACVPMSRRESGLLTKIRTDINRALKQSGA
jgi:hypothetical protein